MAPDSGKPLPFNCPKCGQKLTFHNARTETNAKGQPEEITVYLCITHGFFHFTDSQGLNRGM
jgi:hypothetical protein